nr:hypothetical protein [Rhodococcus sp. (in: high G+C Gram-positive bacteria)]
MSHPELQPIADAGAKIRAIETSLHNAYEEARGVQFDDNDNPSVAAIVVKNRLAVFECDKSVIDHYAHLAAQQKADPVGTADQAPALLEFNTLINGVILAAMQDFQNDLNARIGA